MGYDNFDILNYDLLTNNYLAVSSKCMLETAGVEYLNTFRLVTSANFQFFEYLLNLEFGHWSEYIYIG